MFWLGFLLGSAWIIGVAVYLIWWSNDNIGPKF